MPFNFATGVLLVKFIDKALYIFFLSYSTNWKTIIVVGKHERNHHVVCMVTLGIESINSVSLEIIKCKPIITLYAYPALCQSRFPHVTVGKRRQTAVEYLKDLF